MTTKQLTIKLAALMLVLVFILPSCDNSNTEEEPEVIKQSQPRVPIELDQSTRAVAMDLMGFYFNFTSDMFKYADEKTKDENVIVSPLSASFVLAMMANGVDEDVQKEITSYLGVSDIETLNKLMLILNTELPKVDNGVTMSLANLFAVNSPLKLNSTYSATLENYYQSSILYEDFSKNNSKTLNAINDWGKSNTKGLIPNYLNQLPADLAGIALNATYFKAFWSEGQNFDKTKTKEGVFHSVKGDKKVEMMNGLIEDCVYWENENLESISLLFGNQSFALDIILPKDGKSLNDAKSYLTLENYIDILTNSVWGDIDVTMPKFTVNSNYDLGKIYEHAGLSKLTSVHNLKMFENDFTGLIKFKQGCSFKVNEEGGEIAAISSAEIWDSACPTHAPSSVVIDRPFIFYVREVGTMAVLLSGRISNP